MLDGLATVEPNFVGVGAPGQTLAVDYDIEGSDLGYRWFAREGIEPLFPFGHGLSYTSFAHEGLEVSRDGDGLIARFTVRNTGARAGADVPQVYLAEASGRPLRRLAGFAKVELAPGEARTLEVPLEWRTLAEWEGDGWAVASGRYRFVLAKDALAEGPSATLELSGRRLEN